MKDATKERKTDSISELIKKTDKENPKSEDLKKLRELLNSDNTLVWLNESSEQAFNRVSAAASNDRDRKRREKATLLRHKRQPSRKR